MLDAHPGEINEGGVRDHCARLVPLGGGQRVAHFMDAQEIERLCDELSELAGTGPSKDPGALVKARGILRLITQAPEATTHVRERATEVDRALSGWFDADERFHVVLKGYSSDIYTLIERLHGALREAARFRPR